MNYYIISFVIYEKSTIIKLDTSIHKTLRSAYIFILNEILKIIKKSDEKLKKLYSSNYIYLSKKKFFLNISPWDDILNDMIEDLNSNYCENLVKYNITKYNGLLEINNLDLSFISDINIPDNLMINEERQLKKVSDNFINEEPPLKKNKKN